MTDSTRRPAPVDEALFQLLVEDSLFGIYLVQDSQIKYVNAPLAAMLGYRPDDLIGRNLLDVVHPDDRQIVTDNLRARLEGQVEVLYYTLRGLRKDGGIVHVEVLGRRVQHEGRPAILGTMLNITQRKRAEDLVQDNETRYRQMFEDHVAVMLLIDPANGAIVDANGAACDFYGYSRERLSAMKITDLNTLPPEQVAQEMARAASLQRNYFIFPHRLASGEIRTVEVHSGPVNLGGARRLYSIIHDITERTRAEAELKKRTGQLRLLHDGGRQLSQSLDPDAIYDTLYQVVSGVMDCDVLLLSEYDPHDNLIRCVHMRYEGQVKDPGELPPIPLNPEGRGTQSVAIRTGQSLLLNDYLTHLQTTANLYHFDDKKITKVAQPPAEEANTTRSALIVPLKLEGQIVGVIQVLSYRLDAYTDDDLWLLEALASHISITGKNAVLYRRAQDELAEREQAEAALKKRTEQLRLLHEASRQLSQSLDLNRIYETLYHVIVGVMNCDTLILSRYTPQDSLIRCSHIRHEGQVMDADELPSIPLEPEGRGAQSIAIRTGRSLLLNDFQAHVRTAITNYYFDGEQLVEASGKPLELEEEQVSRSALIVPLKLEGEIVGVIQVLSYRLNAYTDDDLWLLEALASHVVAASHNAALYRQAQDELAERRRAEESLRASEEKFRVIFNESPDVILITDDKGFIQSANHAARTLLGYEETQLVGQPFSRLLPADEETALSIWDAGPGFAGARLGVSDFRRAGGDTIPMDWTATRINWESGWAWLLTLRDASERLLLEEERLKGEMLHLEIQKERELIELREQFISMISHEFRNPLAVILSSSELLDRYRHRLTVERQTEHLAEIKRQVRNMSEMIEDILKISKARAGKIKFNPAPMDVSEFCRLTIRRLEETTGAHHRLVFASDGEYPGVLLDEKLLSHILVNLLSNAIKYSPQGGEVRLSLSSAENCLVFQVSDQGIGIPEADLQHLFKPFQRATNVGEIEGTGLGLAVVKDNLDLHGGTITVESQEGVGTTFTIWLPCGTATDG